MTVQEIIPADRRRALDQLNTVLQLATDLANKAGIDMPDVSIAGPGNARRSSGPVVFGKLAEQAYKERQLRLKYFDSSLFGEAAWDIMLDLFKQATHKRQVSITSACIASGVPSTTALRWVSILIEQGLVVRTGDPSDRRRAFVELSQQGAVKLREYFEAVEAYRSV